MNRSAMAVSGVLIALGAGGCGGGGRTSAAVTGTVAYRERMALPPDAVVEVVLEEVSRADAPAAALGSMRIDTPGQPPIDFRIPYDARRIDAGHRYSVRARITVGDELLFVSDASYPVLTQGHGKTVDVLVRRATGAPRGSTTAGPAPFTGLPASFVGDLPCADCQGVRYHLNLFPDRIFFLRMTALGRGPDASLDAIGTWSVSTDGGTLALQSGREAPLLFAIASDRTLRKLDTEGRAIQSSLPHDLVRADVLQPLEPRLTLRGMYMYMADAGLFRECLTGQRWRVAPEAANAKLESAYGEARQKAGDEVLASVEGRVATRPKMEGDGVETVLVVDRLIGIWVNETCGPRAAGGSPALENTTWKLTHVRGAPIAAPDEQRRPHLLLESGRVAGSGGCNRLFGGYTLEGATLRFTGMGSTRMACPDMGTETAFLQALERVTTWKIVDAAHELSDAQGALLLRFEARPPG